VVLTSARWKLISRRLSEIAAAVTAARRGALNEVEIPSD